MKLSLSMIVKDEERFLPDCLESVKNLVDEIVIADTGSRDRTREIARDYGARVIDFPWRQDFAAARNESLRHTTGDWILYLDADERIDKAHHPKIRRLISSRNAEAYLLNLKSRIGVDEDAQYHIVAYPRLFKKIKGVRFTGKVHEQITGSLNEVGARIVATDVVVDHLGYAQSEEVILEKARRNYSLLLEQVERRENYGYALYQLGQTEIVLGDNEKGVAHLREALAAGGFGDSVAASIHGLIAENMFRIGNHEAALIACEKSLAAGPEQAFAKILKGDVLMKMNRPHEAAMSFQEAVDFYDRGVLEGKVSTAIEPVFPAEMLYARLGKAASQAGHLEKASLYLGKSALQKRTGQRIAAYLEVLLKRKAFSEVFEAAAEFHEFESEDWFLRLVSSAYIDSGNFSAAALLLERISVPDSVSLSSLANCRMKMGDFEGSEKAFLSAFDLGYDDTQGLELLGLVQFKLMKFQEATRTFSRVLEMNPENEKAARFLRAARAQAGAQTVGG